MVNRHGEYHWCEALYDAKAAELILYGRALGLDHGEAEDVLQETFLLLLRLPEPPAKPEHYCVRSLRWFEKSPDETPAERAAMQALASLPVDQREVIVLKIWQGCTFEEIGGLLEISPNTAAGRYRYGLQKVKNKITGIFYERDEPTGTANALLAATPAFNRA
jgi:DNA-directed RNA polymerase specialized sigma24 family protein